MESQSLMTPPRPLGSAHHGASANTTPEELAPGHVLGNRYELLNLVADGGTSRVFRARDLEAEASGAGDPVVAIKVPHHNGDQDLARDLVRHEALIARQLTHPHIVHIYDFARDGGVWFLVMEWIVGQPLGELLQRRHGSRLPARQAEHLLAAVADALAYCHRRGVVHCDVKPANILVNDRGEPRLLDFATARYVAGHERGALSSSAGPAFSGYSPAYASPQLAGGDAPEPADDIYSLARVAHRIMAGHLPREGAGLGIGEAVGLNRWQCRVLTRALAESPGHRYASAPGFARELRRARTVLPRRTAAVALTATTTAALWLSVIGIQHIRAETAVNEHHESLDARAETLVRQAWQTSPDQLPDLLKKAAALPPPWQGSALRRLQPTAVQTIRGHVQRELDSVSSPATLQALDELVAAMAVHYPDSARLQGLRERVAAAREPWTAGLAETYRKAWLQSNFQPGEARRLRELAGHLRRQGKDPSRHTPERAAQRYREALQQAVRDADFRRVHTLAAFQKRLGALAGLDAVTAEFDPAKLDAAAALQAYAEGSSPTFPNEAAVELYTGFLDRLGRRLTSSWSTDVLLEVKTQLRQRTQILPPDFPPLAEVRHELKRRLSVKARYYAGIGEAQRADYYRRLRGELAGQD